MLKCWLPLTLLPLVLSAGVIVDEHFTTLDAWESVKFEKIDKLSTYQATPNGLLLESNDSASALRLKGEYDVQSSPLLSFEWKTTQCMIDGDPKTKQGDDAPIRIYVAWAYDPQSATVFESIVHETLKLFYGEYPPNAVLNYVLRPRAIQKSYTSPYTDRVKIIPLGSCEHDLNQIKRYKRDVVHDYYEHFGVMPSGKATLGVMADSDNSHGASKAQIRFIRLESNEIKP